MTNKDALDYAWKWFEYHAAQRMQAFRFFLILLGALVLGISSGLRESEVRLTSAIALFGVFISLVFLLLEVRNEQLVSVGREALRHLEESDTLLKSNPLLQLQARDRRRHVLLSHKMWLRAIYVVCVVMFLIAAVDPTAALGRK